MPDNKGKQFESIFKHDFAKSTGGVIDRIYDPGFGMKGIKNICDFIAYKYPNMFYLECKSIKGNTFPLSNLTQYEKLREKKGIHGIRAGAIIWFRDHDRIVYVPISTFEQCFNEGLKSINIKMVGNTAYKIIEIPSIKKRVYLESDYSVLLQLKDEGEY